MIFQTPKKTDPSLEADANLTSDTCQIECLSLPINMIDWIVFYAVSAMFQLYNGGPLIWKIADSV